jgi:hypothetical protein
MTFKNFLVCGFTKICSVKKVYTCGLGVAALPLLIFSDPPKIVRALAVARVFQELELAKRCTT